MTTNLFVIANVKQLRTGCSFRILLPFSRTSWDVGVLNSVIFLVFAVGLSLTRFWRAFGISGGGFEHTKLPLRYATVLEHPCTYSNMVCLQNWLQSAMVVGQKRCSCWIRQAGTRRKTSYVRNVASWKVRLLR